MTRLVRRKPVLLLKIQIRIPQKPATRPTARARSTSNRGSPRRKSQAYGARATNYRSATENLDVQHKALLPSRRRRREALLAGATDGKGMKHVEPGQQNGEDCWIRTYAAQLTLILRIEDDKLKANKRQSIWSRDHGDAADVRGLRPSLNAQKGNTKKYKKRRK